MNAMNEETRAAVEEVRQTNCEFLAVPQAEKILKVSRNLAYDLIHAKLLRAVKLGEPEGFNFCRRGVYPGHGCWYNRI